MTTECPILLSTKAVVNSEMLDVLEYLQSDNGGGALDFLEVLDDIITETIIAEDGNPVDRMAFITRLSQLKLQLKKLGNIR